MQSEKAKKQLRVVVKIEDDRFVLHLITQDNICMHVKSHVKI